MTIQDELITIGSSIEAFEQACCYVFPFSSREKEENGEESSEEHDEEKTFPLFKRQFFMVEVFGFVVHKNEKFRERPISALVNERQVKLTSSELIIKHYLDESPFLGVSYREITTALRMILGYKLVSESNDKEYREEMVKEFLGETVFNSSLESFLEKQRVAKFKEHPGLDLSHITDDALEKTLKDLKLNRKLFSKASLFLFPDDDWEKARKLLPSGTSRENAVYVLLSPYFSALGEPFGCADHKTALLQQGNLHNLTFLVLSYMLNPQKSDVSEEDIGINLNRTYKCIATLMNMSFEEEDFLEDPLDNLFALFTMIFGEEDFSAAMLETIEASNFMREGGNI